MSNADKILESVENVAEQLKAIKKKGGKWYNILDEVAKVAVKETESAVVDWSGVNKKKFAMELVEKLWFRYLNLKRLPDFVERPLVLWVADKAIEAAVFFFNKTGVFKKSTPA